MPGALPKRVMHVRNPPQPFMPQAVPHNDMPDFGARGAGEGEEYQNGDYPYDFEEGDPILPEPCWGQHPDPEYNKALRYRKPQRQWGDTAELSFPSTALGTAVTDQSDQILDLRLDLPAVCLVRLSAVDKNAFVTVPGANAVATFLLDLGTGRSVQQKTYQVLVGPRDGSVDTDKYITIPLHALRAQCSVTVNNFTPKMVIAVTIHVAPFTAYADLVHP